MACPPVTDLLLFGGTGQAGRRIAAFLAPRITGRITIASRNLEKTDYWCRRIAADNGNGATLEPASVDIGYPPLLAQAMLEHDLVTVCVPVTFAVLDVFIDAALSVDIDCVELSPSRQAGAV